MSLLRLGAVEKRFGDRVLFSDVTLEVRAGDRLGLIGPNGAGKSTLLHIAAGLDAPDGGERAVPRHVRVALLRQEIDPTLERSVRDEAATALAALDALEDEMRELERRMEALGREHAEVPADLAARYDTARSRFELAGGFDRAARVDRVLAGLGFDERDRARPLSSFSGGWLMRVELAKLLLAEPDVLLLDEPTNHLDLPSIEWFEEEIRSFRGAVVIVSHDRTFLRRHATSIAALENGACLWTQGGLDRHFAEREEQREQLLARQRNQERKLAQTERFIERFRYKATKARQVQSRVKQLAKIERVEVAPESRRRIRLRIPPPARAGALVLRLEGIHKSYGETAVYHGVNFELQRGERVALVGPNGAGKSTLLRIAAGVLPFERGERAPGHNVTGAFFAQHQLEALNPTASVLEELASVAKTDDLPRLRHHLGAFLFSGDDVEKKVGVLSGGEKSRLALAKLLLRPANLLVLDEPTNHLDVEACEVLEEALREYAGTLLFISHDRTFIDALATRVVEVRAGALREFSGDYDAFLARRAGEAAPPDLPV
ncbi:MAG TPA: ABC-F family ATP-binding cassette domain-containing protein, partial [Myxococcota bacterium]|nr:ABC-F family ATP-binding cassette domain-containing protein [Myxococcota bacterium]